jgi:hypothetical protein
VDMPQSRISASFLSVTSPACEDLLNDVSPIIVNVLKLFGCGHVVERNGVWVDAPVRKFKLGSRDP